MAVLFNNDTGIEQAERHTNDNIKDVACMCWFTSTGRTLPRFISFKDEDGIRQNAEVEILEVNETKYAGVPATEHRCTLYLRGIKVEINLILYKEESKWEIHYK